jgi:hypothetical protein
MSGDHIIIAQHYSDSVDGKVNLVCDGLTTAFFVLGSANSYKLRGALEGATVVC